MGVSRQMLVLGFSNVLFMAAYLALKITVSLYFSPQGLTEAYAIATGSSALFAVNALIFSALSRRYFSHRLLLTWGLLLNTLAFLCFLSSRLDWQLLGVALWVVGSGMYVVNFNIMINKMFDADIPRQHANHLRKLEMELGGIVGVVIVAILLYRSGYNALYLVCGGCMLASLLSLLSYYFGLYHEPPHVTPHWHWLRERHAKYLAYSAPAAVLLMDYVLLLHEPLTRYLLISIFIILYSGIIVKAILARKSHYLSFLCLITLVSLIYWLAVTTLYNQFNVFLVNDVSSTVFGWHVPPLAMLVFDSVSGLVFGSMITLYYAKYPIKSATKLQLGIFLIALAYGLLVLGLYLRPAGALLNVGWAFAMICIMAIAMFFISPTLVAMVNQLIKRDEPREFFTGMLQMVSAFIIVVAYFFFQNGHTQAGDEQR